MRVREAARLSNIPGPLDDEAFFSVYSHEDSDEDRLATMLSDDLRRALIDFRARVGPLDVSRQGIFLRIRIGGWLSKEDSMLALIELAKRVCNGYMQAGGYK